MKAFGEVKNKEEAFLSFRLPFFVCRFHLERVEEIGRRTFPVGNPSSGVVSVSDCGPGANSSGSTTERLVPLEVRSATRVKTNIFGKKPRGGLKNHASVYGPNSQDHQAGIPDNLLEMRASVCMAVREGRAHECRLKSAKGEATRKRSLPCPLF